ARLDRQVVAARLLSARDRRRDLPSRAPRRPPRAAPVAARRRHVAPGEARRLEGVRERRRRRAHDALARRREPSAAGRDHRARRPCARADARQAPRAPRRPRPRPAPLPDHRPARGQGREHPGLRQARRGARRRRPEDVVADAAAFFDLDRTLIRRSSALALAPAFRAAGIISRRQLAKAAAWQVLFQARGASHEAVRRASEDGLTVLRGFTPEELRAIVTNSMERVLRPLVYAESLDLVDAIAADLGFDGALGTVCEVVDGHYTGRAIRALHADNKARCIEELGFDLASSRRTPTATPTCRSSKRSGTRCASTLIARCGALRARAAGRCWSSVVDEEEGLRRLTALGFHADDASVLWRHFDDAERRGKGGHGHSRIPWLEQQGFATDRPSRRWVESDGLERWDGAGSVGYLVLDAVVEATIARPPQGARLVVCERTFPTGMLGHYARRLADAGLVSVLTATSPARLGPPDGAKLAGTNPLAIGIPSRDGRHVVVDVSMG